MTNSERFENFDNVNVRLKLSVGVPTNKIDIENGIIKKSDNGELIIQGDLQLRDSNNADPSRIFFSDINGSWFSSIGYRYAEGVRFLELVGAAYGTSAEPKRRTRIMGDLFVRPSATSIGNIVTSNGTIEGKEGRFQNLDVGGDLVIRDSTGNQSRIYFSDINGNWFSSIGYTYADGVRYLSLVGAAYGTPSEPKRRTRIMGDLFVQPSETSRGIIEATDVLINSSQELKQDISNLTKEEAYSVLENLEPVKFSFKNDSSKRDNIGFIAEDVPDIVSDDDHKSVRYMEIISALTKVVKELKNEVNELKEKINFQDDIN